MVMRTMERKKAGERDRGNTDPNVCICVLIGYSEQLSPKLKSGAENRRWASKPRGDLKNRYSRQGTVSAKALRQ